MLAFKSLVLYKDLQKFFAPENEQFTKILVAKFNKQDFEYIKQELKDEFSEKFFECLEIGKKDFFGVQLLNVLKSFYNQLKQEYDQCICFIKTAKELSISQKKEIEAMLVKKFSLKFLGCPGCDEEQINFHYELDPSILHGVIVKVNGKYYDASFKNVMMELQSRIQEDVL